MADKYLPIQLPAPVDLTQNPKLISGLRVIHEGWQELDGGRLFRDQGSNSWIAYWVVRFVRDETNDPR